MAFATLFSTKVYMEGTVGKADRAEEKMAERVMPAKTDQMMAKEETPSMKSMKLMAKDDDATMKEDDPTMKAEEEKSADAMPARSEDGEAEDSDAQERAPKEEMAEMREEKPVVPPGPTFGSPEFAEACGIYVDIPDSYGLVYVRPSKSVPIRVMTAAAYLQLLKSRCPAIVGGGS